jgi:hypothetical protein
MKRVEQTPAQRRAFLIYYAGVMTREADARPGHNVQWMRDGAERALQQAAALDPRPAQRDLFASEAA